MDNDTRLEIYSYLKKFLSQKEKHNDYIDFYEVYGLSENMTVEEIKNKLHDKRIKELFTKEQINYLEDGYKKTFEESLEIIKRTFKVFENEASKSIYDKDLQDKKKKRYVEKQSKNYNQVDITKEDEKILYQALEATTTKHGIYHGLMALNKASKGEYSNITNDNNSRNKVQELGKEKINQIIYNKRKNIMEEQEDNINMDYFTSFISKTPLKEKINTFYKVCIETVKKYDLNDNKGQLETALDKYLENKDPASFTNEDNARDNFIANKFSKNDIKVLMYMRLNSLDDTRYKLSNMKNLHDKDLVNIFSEIIVNQVANLN